MYKSIIDIRKDVSNEVLKEMVACADRAFHNRAGKVKNVSTSPYRLSYEGEEDKFGCLNLGVLSLYDQKTFVSNVLSWKWIDEEEPDENCDVLEGLAKPVK